MHELLSGIIKKEEAEKIATYFPPNYLVHFIYKASIDGFSSQNFGLKVFNSGPTLIILRTTNKVLCGGFTTQSWTGEKRFQEDQHAFVFNMQAKYEPLDRTKAIFSHSDGFGFGEGALQLKGDFLNREKMGRCIGGEESFYNI